MRASVNIRTNNGKPEKVAKRIRRISGVSESFPVFGWVDVVALVEVPTASDLQRVVTAINKTWGVGVVEAFPEMVLI